MIPALLLANDLMIRWVAAWMAPLEATFAMIESELDRQRADESKDSENASGMTRDVDELSRPEGPGIISRLLRHLPWRR